MINKLNYITSKLFSGLIHSDKNKRIFGSVKPVPLMYFEENILIELPFSFV